MEPRDYTQALETSARLPAGSQERYNGYGVMGLTFASGHILALRRFPASSVGPGYTSIWHRTPKGEWTFYADVAARQSCMRYFGKSAVAAIEIPITLSWTTARRLSVRIRAVDLDWWLEVRATPATRALNQVSRLLPEAAWRKRGVLQLIAATAGVMLRLGHVRLTGAVPNGQHFIATPRRMWMVAASRAVLAGEDFGLPGPVQPQARLGDFWIPQRGVLALAQAFFDPFDAQHHSADSRGLAA